MTEAAPVTILSIITDIEPHTIGNHTWIPCRTEANEIWWVEESEIPKEIRTGK